MSSQLSAEPPAPDPSMAHPGFRRVFTPGRITLGLMFAIESYPGAVPTMEGQIELARRAEALGFSALWVRDVPLHVPEFGDVGQIYDPWVYLGYVAAHTRAIALVTGAIIAPLRHPIDVAKGAASVDRLSGGRFLLGVATGDRPVEYPAYGRPHVDVGAAFRETVCFVRRLLEESFPRVDSPLGHLSGGDLLPKPVTGRLPLLVTGSSRQSVEWIARHADAWVMYPRPVSMQAQVVSAWREAVEQAAPGAFKPFAQSLYVDLLADPWAAPRPMHLGFRLGRRALLELLVQLRSIGVHHVTLNLKYGSRPAAEVVEELGSEVLPELAAG